MRWLSFERAEELLRIRQRIHQQNMALLILTSPLLLLPMVRRKKKDT